MPNRPPFFLVSYFILEVSCLCIQIERKRGFFGSFTGQPLRDAKKRVGSKKNYANVFFGRNSKFLEIIPIFFQFSRKAIRLI